MKELQRNVALPPTHTHIYTHTFGFQSILDPAWLHVFECPLRNKTAGFLQASYRMIPTPHQPTEFRLSPSRLRDWRISSRVGTELRDPAVKCCLLGMLPGDGLFEIGLGMISSPAHRNLLGCAVLKIRKAASHSCINLVFPQQRKLMGSSAQNNSGVR